MHGLEEQDQSRTCRLKRTFVPTLLLTLLLLILPIKNEMLQILHPVERVHKLRLALFDQTSTDPSPSKL